MKQLSELKEGDYVFQALGYGDWKKAKITRLTKTQIVIAGIKYRRDTGYLVGGGNWGVGGHISVWTEDNQIEWEFKLMHYRNKKLLTRFRDVVLPSNLTNAQYDQLHELMREHGYKDEE